MKIILASPRGFCAGVNMAIESLDLAINAFGAPIYVYHEIVHNKYVVDTFREKGAVFVDTRAATFYQNERIKGALNVPSSDFEDNYKAVPKNKKVIAYCS